MVWNFVVYGIMSAWFPWKINCIYVVKFDFLYQLSWWQNEKFPNLQRNMQITRTLVTCINAITCRNKNMQIRAYIYFECQTFSHDTHDKKKNTRFFPQKIYMIRRWIWWHFLGWPMTQILDSGHRWPPQRHLTRMCDACPQHYSFQTNLPKALHMSIFWTCRLWRLLIQNINNNPAHIKEKLFFTFNCQCCTIYHLWPKRPCSFWTFVISEWLDL